MNFSIEEFIHLSREAQTVDELFRMYENVISNLGFEHLAYAIISDHPTLTTGNPLGLVQMNNLNGWDEHYLEKNYMEIDPTHVMTYSNPGIYSWRNIEKTQNLSIAQTTIFREVEEAKLFQGSSFAVHGTNGTKGVAIAASNQRNRNFDRFTYDAVNVISQQFHLCLLSFDENLSTHFLPPISQREADILKWTAAGLTKIEISKRLNISSHTVDYHMRKIFQKLGAKNTTMAVVIAIKNNLISI